MENNDQIIEWGEEPPLSSHPEPTITTTKTSVNDYDIFRLAKWILAVAASVYILFGLIREYYPGHEFVLDGKTAVSNEGIIEVWEYTKVFLNSIISLILGLYFGAKAESIKKK